jgi:hypothetical protein
MECSCIHIPAALPSALRAVQSAKASLREAVTSIASGFSSDFSTEMLKSYPRSKEIVASNVKAALEGGSTRIRFAAT